MNRRIISMNNADRETFGKRGDGSQAGSSVAHLDSDQGRYPQTTNPNANTGQDLIKKDYFFNKNFSNKFYEKTDNFKRRDLVNDQINHCSATNFNTGSDFEEVSGVGKNNSLSGMFQPDDGSMGGKGCGTLDSSQEYFTNKSITKNLREKELELKQKQKELKSIQVKKQKLVEESARITSPHKVKMAINFGNFVSGGGNLTGFDVDDMKSEPNPKVADDLSDVFSEKSFKKANAKLNIDDNRESLSKHQRGLRDGKNLNFPRNLNRFNVAPRSTVDKPLADELLQNEANKKLPRNEAFGMRDSQNLKSITAINEKIKMHEKNLEEIHSKAQPKKTHGCQQNSTNKQRSAHTSNYSDIHHIKSGSSYSKKDSSKLIISQLDDSASPTKIDKTKMVLGNSNIEILENNSLGKQNFFGQTLSQKSSHTDHISNMTNHSKALYGSIYGGNNNRENHGCEYSKVNGK